MQPQSPIQQFDQPIFTPKLIMFAVLIILLGSATGYGIVRLKGGAIINTKVQVAPGAKVNNQEVGLQDEKTFKDSAEGVLQKGGVDGEGTHHLERDGGASQNVYLTSSVINLDQFAGKKVKVWGETFKGQKAGWLMDVGRIRIE